MKGRELASPSDTRVHCRAASVAAGLPSGWRTGERQRFAENVLRRYSAGGAMVSASALAHGWRLNSGTGIHVSLSDTGTHYLIGVGHGVPIGIDAEAARPVDDALPTLRRLGLRQIVTTLSAIPAPARNRAFLRIWTAFESFLKLERLTWDEGARRFAALERHWIIGPKGEARFQRERANLAFEHVEVENALVVGISSPLPAKIQLKRLDLALPLKAASGIASA